MKAGAVHRVYEHLSSAERFRLIVRAQARGDVAEGEHLVRSCRTVGASVQDPEMHRLLDAAYDLVDALVRATAPFWGWLDLLEAIDPPVAALVELLAGANAPAQDPAPDPHSGEGPRDPEDGFAVGIMGVAYRYALGMIKTIVLGFEVACRRELGVEPDVVLLAQAPFLAERLARYQAALATATLTGDLLETSTEGFLAVCGKG